MDITQEDIDSIVPDRFKGRDLGKLPSGMRNKVQKTVEHREIEAEQRGGT